MCGQSWKFHGMSAPLAFVQEDANVGHQSHMFSYGYSPGMIPSGTFEIGQCEVGNLGVRISLMYDMGVLQPQHGQRICQGGPTA